MAGKESDKNFNELLYEKEKILADKVLLKQPIDGKWYEFTWAEAMSQARKMVAFLKSLGLKKGDRVAILSKNCAEWVIADFAISMGGFIIVPFFPNQHKDVVAYILEHADVKAIFVGKLDNWQLIEPVIGNHIIRIDFPYENPMPAKYHWKDIVATTEPDMDNHVPELNDTYMILYTSGTTGNPKGVMYDYRGIANCLLIVDEMLSIGRLPDLKHSYSLAISPLGHTMGHMALFQIVNNLHTVYFVESIPTFMDNLQYAQPTTFGTVPRMWTQFQKAILGVLPQKKLDLLLKIPLINRLIKKKLKKSLGLSRSEFNVSGAAPLSKELSDWYAKLDIHIVEGYGQTENMSIASIGQTGHHIVGTVGKAWPGVEIKISDEGEILTRSKSIMSGYYKNPEATKEAFTGDGFLCTGDMGTLDEEGNLTVLGRFKDPFKTDKGEFINPIPIEAHFYANPYIEQICLIGMTLIQPVLILTLSEGAKKLSHGEVHDSLKQTLDMINTGLTPFEKISHIIIAKEMWTPENNLMTPSLKVKRNAIHQKFIGMAKKLVNQKDTIFWE